MKESTVNRGMLFAFLAGCGNVGHLIGERIGGSVPRERRLTRPHIGDRQCRRLRRQIKSGQITKANRGVVEVA